MLQAYNDWHIDEWCGTYPGRFIPLALPADLGPRADGRRGAPRRGEGLPRRHVLGEPREARPPELPHRRTGTRSGRRAPTRARSSACTSARRRSWSITAVDAPIDVMITLQPMNIVQARPTCCGRRCCAKFPTLQHRAVRGRHRLDPVLPRAGRLRLPAPPRVDRTRTSATSCRARCSASASSPASSTTRSGSRSATTSASTGSAGSATTRTPTRRGPTRPSAWRSRSTGVPDDEIDQDHPPERDARTSGTTRSPIARPRSARSARCGPRRSTSTSPSAARASRRPSARVRSPSPTSSTRRPASSRTRVTTRSEVPPGTAALVVRGRPPCPPPAPAMWWPWPGRELRARAMPPGRSRRWR